MGNDHGSPKRLYRSRSSRVVFGVCGGLGEYFGVDPVLFRLLFVLLTFGAGSGVLLYILAALVMPLESESQNSTGIPSANFKERVEGLAAELRSQHDTGDRRSIWLGIIIIVFGAILLVNQFLPNGFLDWGVILALIVIIFGFYFIGRRRQTPTNPSIPAVSLNDSQADAAGETIQEKPHVKEVVREIHHHHRSGSGLFGLLFGLIIVVVGVAILAQNLGIITGLDFHYFADYWPVLIIIAGLSVLSRGTWLGAVLAFLITLVLIAFVVLSFIFPYGNGEIITEDFALAYDSAVTRAIVEINAGAGNVLITNAASGLVSGRIESNVADLLVSTSSADNMERVSIKTEGSLRLFGGKFKNDLSVQLPENIPLVLDVDAGASKLDIDASLLKLESLHLDAGASSVALKLGSIMPTSTVSISSGASSINISIPREVGVHLELESSLASSKKLLDFQKLDDNTYETANYASAPKKLDIDIDSGISSVVIRPY